MKEKFNFFADLFKDDFPCPKALEAELDLWETYWLESKDCLPGIISSTLKRIPFNGFNNIKVCIRILDFSLVKMCTCEWSFPFMRRLKMYAREAPWFQKMVLYSSMHIRKQKISLT